MSKSKTNRQNNFGNVRKNRDQIKRGRKKERRERTEEEMGDAIKIALLLVLSNFQTGSSNLAKFRRIAQLLPLCYYRSFSFSGAKFLSEF